MFLITHFSWLIALVAAVIWLGIAALLRVKKRTSLMFLSFFTIFFVYLFKVLDYTLLQFQSLLLLKHFLPTLILRGSEAGESLNLIPLLTLTPEDVKTSLLNVLLFVPFGFGLPFIAARRMGKTVMAGMLFSIAIEALQFLTGLIGGMTFRVTDINDVIFNTIGVAMGYLLLAGFGRLAQAWTHSRYPLLRYIAKRSETNTIR